MKSLIEICQVREHAAAVLAGLMKGGDENLASSFRDHALAEANNILKTKRRWLFFESVLHFQFKFISCLHA